MLSTEYVASRFGVSDELNTNDDIPEIVNNHKNIPVHL